MNLVNPDVSSCKNYLVGQGHPCAKSQTAPTGEVRFVDKNLQKSGSLAHRESGEHEAVAGFGNIHTKGQTDIEIIFWALDFPGG